MSSMDFNKILEHLGHLGFFQCFVFCLICIVQTFVGMHMLANVFLMAEPKHRCFINHCDTNNTNYNSVNNFSFSIPYIEDEQGDYVPNPCKRYMQIPGATTCDKESFLNSTTDCSGYVWDSSEFEETVVSEFEIVCKKSWNGASSQSIFMGGVLLGSAGFGMISDRIGRRTVILTSAAIMLGSSIGTAFSPNFKVFTVLRFITAAAVSGLFQTGYIVGVEFIGTSKRLWCANIMQIVFAVGELVLGLIAYFVRKWQKLELFISIPAVLLLGYYWLLPESVRWLISKGKHARAKETILKAAKWNKKTIPDHLLRSAEYTITPNDPEFDIPQTSSGPLSLFKHSHLRKWSLNIFFNWIVNAMVYYGLSLSAAHLSGNTYLNFAVLAAVEIPAVFFVTILLARFGRRWVLCIIMVLGGIACASTLFIPQSLGWLSTTLAVIGKSAIAASFAVIYIYSAEIYPTVVRSTGIGLSSMFARIGAIIAPIINELRKVYRPLPMIIFAAASIIAGFMALLLPETHNRQLPETIEEAERFALGQMNDVINVPRSRLLGRFGSASQTVRDVRRLGEESERLLT